eukprot:SAG11_NODE_2094_length_3834_cov_1.595181_6_plen_146_part_01
MALLSGGDKLYSDKLTYLFLERLPSFIGLYCGNICYVLIIQWAAFSLAFWIAFLPAYAPLSYYVLFVTPVALESAIKTLMWRHIIDYSDGNRHPRLYALADTFLSITGTITGPIKTVFRVSASMLCLIMHLFRADILLTVCYKKPH